MDSLQELRTASCVLRTVLRNPQENMQFADAELRSGLGGASRHGQP